MQTREVASVPGRRAALVQKSSWCLMLAFGAAAVIACSADKVQDAVISELAVGTWACAPDAKGAGEDPFTVQVDAGGTFDVQYEKEPDELSGSWAIEDGDLEWGFDLRREDFGNVVIEQFDDLTVDSRELTLTNPGIFKSTADTDDPPNEQAVRIDARGTDSVTLTIPGGEPWTCDRA